MKPWIKRRTVEDAIEVLENGERDWNYLSSEEKHGTVVQALELLRKDADQ